MATRQVDLDVRRDAGRRPGPDPVGPRARWPTPTPGSRATAGTPTAGAAGRPPTTSSASHPGAAGRIWAHDHHACGPATPRSALGGLRAGRPGRRRRPARRRREPEGVLHEARRGARDGPHPADGPDDLADAVEASGTSWSRSASSPATTRAASPRTRSSTYAYPVYARLSDAGGLPLRVHACIRDDAVATAIARGQRSGAVLGEDPDGWAPRRLAEVLRRWLARVADGGTPRGHRARAGPPARPRPRRGVWMTDRAGIRANHPRAHPRL